MADRLTRRPDAGWLVLPAPAKINLFLHVTGRRDDGMHELQTAFQLLDWGDEVRLRLRDDPEVRMVEPVAGVEDADNLAVRAAHALLATSGARRGCDIAIRKRIPAGGGLGGASSDAASVLHGLNQLLVLGASEDSLAGIGATLGADVPLFVRGRSAWAEGTGDELTPIELPSRWFAIVHPRVGLSTAAVFTDPGLTRDTPPVTISRFMRGERFRNDLERVATQLQPAIASTLEWLSRYAPAQMTGSGSCVFAAFATREAADAVARKVPVEWNAFVARGVSVSPLKMCLDNAEAGNPISYH